MGGKLLLLQVLRGVRTSHAQQTLQPRTHVRTHARTHARTRAPATSAASVCAPLASPPASRSSASRAEAWSAREGEGRGAARGRGGGGRGVTHTLLLGVGIAQTVYPPSHAQAVPPPLSPTPLSLLTLPQCLDRAFQQTARHNSSGGLQLLKLGGQGVGGGGAGG